jgi:polyisoprenoid-binding protein YceI
MRRSALCTVVLLLCSTGLAAQEPKARIFDVDATRSHIVLVTHRAGLLSFLGHEHAILATEYTAALCLAPEQPAHSSLRVTIPTRSLVIDADTARRLARLGGGPNAETRAEIALKLMDERRLHAEAHPTLTFETVAIQRTRGDSLQVHGRLTIRGVQRDVRLAASLTTVDADAIRLQGRLRFKLSDFGVLAETVAGVVKVSNDADLYVQLFATPTTQECQPRS